MAGHSQFKNIMHRKAAQDKKKGKIATKLIRDIMTAARGGGGGDVNSNSALRTAIEKARKENLVKETIDRAIKRGTGEIAGADYIERTYEGHGPGGVAVIVTALTDNPTRTITSLRTIFNKAGGSVGADGAVAWMFKSVGMIIYPAQIGSEDVVLEAAIEAGAEDVQSDAETHQILTAPTDFAAVKTALCNRFGEAEEAELTYIATQTTAAKDEDHAASVWKFVEALENDDDVQSVVVNLVE
ncbi:MAG: YebC/PmpR family DNA-binding transcriptional regulator [Pseudomonadota bacterium]